MEATGSCPSAEKSLSLVVGLKGVMEATEAQFTS